MDCNYILVCKWGETEIQRSIHGCTPEEAEETARLVIKTYQTRLQLPFVSAKLFRCVKEFSGTEFIKAQQGNQTNRPNEESL